MIEYIFLGILQGIFEWLPISSQGQLFLVMTLLFDISAQEALNSAVWLHTGTMLAAVVYFRRDVTTLVKKFFKLEFDDDLLSFLIVSTVVTGIVGLPLYILMSDISATFGQISIAIVGVALIATGLLQRQAKKAELSDKKISKQDKLVTGAFQGLSIIPGISRSGITTSVLLMRNFTSKQALKLSFLMSIPAVLVAELGLGLVGGIDFSVNYALGAAFSFASGLVSIDIFLRVARRISFWAFCVVMGLLTFVPLFFILV